MTAVSPYSLGLEEGYAAFLATGLPVPPDGGWAGTLVAFLGPDGLLSYFGLPGASKPLLMAALAEYARGCEDGHRDAQKDAAVV